LPSIGSIQPLNTHKSRNLTYGTKGFAHGMTKERLQKIKVLEQEVDLLKQLLAEKELESKLKDAMLKKSIQR